MSVETWEADETWSQDSRELLIDLVDDPLVNNQEKGQIWDVINDASSSLLTIQTLLTQIEERMMERLDMQQVINSLMGAQARPESFLQSLADLKTYYDPAGLEERNALKPEIRIRRARQLHLDRMKERHHK